MFHKTDRRNVARVEAALQRAGLRHTCDAIEAGEGGVVILYAAGGWPVTSVESVEEALAWARDPRRAR